MHAAAASRFLNMSYRFDATIYLSKTEMLKPNTPTLRKLAVPGGRAHRRPGGHAAPVAGFRLQALRPFWGLLQTVIRAPSYSLVGVFRHA